MMEDKVVLFKEVNRSTDNSNKVAEVSTVKIPVSMVAHSKSTQAAKALMESMSNMKTSDEIKTSLKELTVVLSKLKKDEIENKGIYKLPVLGSYLMSKKLEEEENRYKNGKEFINNLSEVLNKKKNILIEEHHRIDYVIDCIEKDIESNKNELKPYQEILNAIPGNEESELSIGNKTIVAGRISKLTDLIAEQEVQKASLTILKNQNIYLIDEITQNINSSIISLTTSIFIDSHLKTRRELTELSSAAREAASSIMVNIANEVSVQTKNFQERLIKATEPNKNITDAIEITVNLCSNIEEFNHSILPGVLERINNSSTTIGQIEDKLSKMTTVAIEDQSKKG